MVFYWLSIQTGEQCVVAECRGGSVSTMWCWEAVSEHYVVAVCGAEVSISEHYVVAG